MHYLFFPFLMLIMVMFSGAAVAKDSVEKVSTYVCADFDVELYRQANGPVTFQRVMMAVPHSMNGKAPCVVVPFYFSEAMLGFNPVDGSFASGLASAGTNLTFYAGISYMSDLVKRGYVTISADAYHLTYRNGCAEPRVSPPDCGMSPWRCAAKALNADWLDWSGIGKLVFDTRLLVDLAQADARIDAKRIGMIGHSMGCKMAFCAGMTDNRVKVVVASDFGLGWTQINWDADWYWGGRLADMRAQGL